MLFRSIKVLIYAGEYDLICNWLGKSTVDKLMHKTLVQYNVIHKIEVHASTWSSHSLINSVNNVIIVQK